MGVEEGDCDGLTAPARCWPREGWQQGGAGRLALIISLGRFVQLLLWEAEYAGGWVNYQALCSPSGPLKLTPRSRFSRWGHQERKCLLPALVGNRMEKKRSGELGRDGEGVKAPSFAHGDKMAPVTLYLQQVAPLGVCWF